MIYLDNNATTQPDRGMMKTVSELAIKEFGNPSSSHFSGVASNNLIEEAREKVAKSLGVKSNSIIFTSGGTEANNIVMQCLDLPTIISNVEHSSIFNNKKYKMVQVLESGELDFDHLEKLLKFLNGPCLLSVMVANNETGIYLDPNHKLKKLKEKYPFILHTDAVQVYGKDLNYKIPSHVDLVSISGHKVHALKGIGALYFNDNIFFKKTLFNGGMHEFGLRPGTENKIGILSLGYMADRIDNNDYYREKIEGIEAKRNLLEELLQKYTEVNGKDSVRTINTSSLYFKDISDSKFFAELLSSSFGIAVSAGSACSSGEPKPSRVIQNMYSDLDRSKGTVRISLSAHTTEEEIEIASKKIISCIKFYKECQ